ncbi:heparinase [Pseudomonas sp. gcc21]|uniref:heparinase II/III family protein n=1 Tax=Pseudomonas sp. gcc21 TaxID=2726989 RepID=UPI00145169DF|nr:heparinase II/III family protein [Pseudomonas sp. gcc21]QJD58669.1 heparinase [Pseudomonas sp. gcc21]
MPSRTKLLFETARHLTARQIVYQIYYRFVTRKTPEVMELVSPRGAEQWEFPSYAYRSTLDGEKFTFLGKTATLGGQGEWNDPALDKLWLYNLHYLDDLNAVDAEDDRLARELVDAWIAGNPPVTGNGWEPYPLSLRIVNLVKWLGRQTSLDPRWLSSLAMQAQSLSRQIEHHILGNHIFANGKALVFAGAFLNGPLADSWLAQGLGILDRQVDEQFLSDGAHFELSPMYHSILLWDMCDLVKLAQSSSLPGLTLRARQWRAVVERGLKWHLSMLHPDGEIPFFNDAAFGIGPSFAALSSYAESLGLAPPSAVPADLVTATFNAPSGYAAVSLPGETKALIDLARVGPDYQPGHAHADTLSFEMSIFGKRVFVNSGTSQYGENAERHRQRSTAAHNTVEIDGKNSSEVWAGFRVARRAYPTVESFADGDRVVVIKAKHTGYQRLVGRNVHSRAWQFEERSLEVSDAVDGPHGVAVARLYVHPDVTFVNRDGVFTAAVDTADHVQVIFEGAEQVRLKPATWHPRFGEVIENQCIEAVFSCGKLVTRIQWSSSE